MLALNTFLNCTPAHPHHGVMGSNKAASSSGHISSLSPSSYFTKYRPRAALKLWTVPRKVPNPGHSFSKCRPTNSPAKARFFRGCIFAGRASPATTTPASAAQFILLLLQDMVADNMAFHGQLSTSCACAGWLAQWLNPYLAAADGKMAWCPQCPAKRCHPTITHSPCRKTQLFPAQSALVHTLWITADCPLAKLCSLITSSTGISMASQPAGCYLGLADRFIAATRYWLLLVICKVTAR